MKAKMSVVVTLTGKIDSRALYDELLPYNANVIDLGAKTYVRFKVDIKAPTLDEILQICNKYGEYNVSAQSV